jgi:membrane protease YdiL (CAAX protease family)
MVTSVFINSWLQLAVTVALLVLPHVIGWPLPFLYVIPLTLLVWFFLKKENNKFKNLGFDSKLLNIKTIVTGVVAGIGIFIALQYAIFPLIDKILPLPEANLDDFSSIRHNSGMYIFMLLMGWLVGGLYEEMVFRGFIFSSINKFFNNRLIVISILITTTLFALYHAQLGIMGVINAFLAGLGYHAIMLWPKVNIWHAVIAHATFDTIALTYIYLGYY